MKRKEPDLFHIKRQKFLEAIKGVLLGMAFNSEPDIDTDAYCAMKTSERKSWDLE